MVFTLNPRREFKTKPFEYTLIPNEDKDVITIIQPNMKKGPWIAGGAALSWYTRKPLQNSDIDIFCANRIQAQTVMDSISNVGGVLVFDSPSAKTFQFRDKKTDLTQHTIQVITLKYFNSAEELISNFDISVCKIATDGHEFVLGETTAYDINHRILNMQRPLREDSLKRLIKYWCYGYTPSEELLAEIESSPDIKWNFLGQEGDYLNAF